jgi:acylglycerol lipase
MLWAPIILVMVIIIGIIWLSRPVALEQREIIDVVAPDLTSYEVIMPDGAHIACQPWDIGTGVQGYCWQVAHPKAVLLLQHGYAEYATRYVHEYNRLILHLLEQEISVYAFDLWGHGYSGGIRGVVDVRTAVADHIAARAQLADTALPVFLFGHSLGGLIAVSSVLRQPDNVAGMILTSPALPHQPPRLFMRAANLLARFWPSAHAPLPSAPVDGLSRDEVFIQRATDDTLIYHGELTNLVGATALEVAAQNDELYPDWQTPVLLLHGDGDTWADMRGTQRFAEIVEDDDTTLIIYPDGRHQLLSDSDRDQVLHDILAWLTPRIA